ncbi:cytochrome b561 and DOMON domain-containing protein At5g47530-like [Gossypium arboreum]|uniref:cytochrome b561 and DOMON domain-containing protein At5g47530-like n=1 Tax=Gossypium arboreum TaxID=29729 RepID=UPI00081973BE|nr:cytochrome b561 and DOMON domain-containing protein At5g47530-like [Gossypium arboreum]
MVGSQALVAFQKDDGTMVAYTSPITSYATQLQKGDLSFPVNGVSSILEGNEMIMFATLALPANTTTVNHLWQERPLAGNFPRMHPLSGPNMGSMGTLAFLVGKLVVDKNRFKKPMEDSSWNFMHIRMGFSNACLAGGIIGVLLWLGALGARIGRGIHQYIGITLLGLGAIQGIVGIANVFLGFHMVHLMIKTWPQVTYIAAISLLGTIALILEGVGCWRRTTVRREIAAEETL